MLTNIFLLVGGFVFLIYGADYLVKGSASIAKRLGIRTFVIGLTIVAFGTSAPELVVNLLSATTGSSGLALGNIFGSNIANTLLILGVTAIIAPIMMSKGTVWKEIPLSLLAAILVVILGSDIILDGQAPDALTRIDGLVLLSIFLIFLYYTYGISKASADERETVEDLSWKKSAFLVIGGLFGLIIGGKFIVDSAVAIATSFGVSDHLIGATIVAVGTSLPELATAIIAALKKHPEIAVGNVVGSNIFNILFVLGTTATVVPLQYNAYAMQDAYMVAIITIFFFLSMFIGKRHTLTKNAGILFLLLYIAFIGFSVFRA